MTGTTRAGERPEYGGPENGLPVGARLYLSHVAGGHTIRALARAEGCHPSTVLRRVRRIESLRDDPLIDEALERLAAPPPDDVPTPPAAVPRKETCPMSQSFRQPSADPAAARPSALPPEEARRVLRRLAEPGAILAVAPEMDKAAVLRGGVRVAVTDRATAREMALKDWISCTRRQGRVALYEITTAGRAVLKRAMSAAQGLAEAAAPFAEQHRAWGEREVAGEEGARRLRCNLAETPVAVLARRRDKDGQPFLSAELVAAGERLREDFELAQMGPRVTQNWDRFLTAGDRGPAGPGAGLAEGPGAARDRVAAALRDLGPGLGDMVLRCCCYLEGLETAEQRMGWSARSGKIVLRIALIRLHRHYRESYGGAAPLIG